ncbi:MAG: hypothetical protein MPW17_00005 [Candidatus Manganitrophus sp.]|nr:MAG: hypothetical protein MPW17_00005 [Candidatus Manganitrophus sp.]
MFPATCIKPPCRNIEVKTLDAATIDGAPLQSPDQVRRNRAEGEDKFLGRRTERNLIEEHNDIHGDQADRHHRRGAGRKIIFQWDHLGLPFCLLS